jgi:hypothetical protein
VGQPARMFSPRYPDCNNAGDVGPLLEGQRKASFQCSGTPPAQRLPFPNSLGLRARICLSPQRRQTGKHPLGHICASVSSERKHLNQG